MSRGFDGRINATHGRSQTPVYRVWTSARSRCRNVNDKEYPNYGGRGISFSAEWDRFVQFLADMGERPDGMTLERKDNDQGYCKSNCRWATKREQQQNTRRNRRYTYLGETHCESEWLRLLRASPATDGHG